MSEGFINTPRRPAPFLVSLRVATPFIVLLLALLFRDRLIDLLEAALSLQIVHPVIFLFSTRSERLLGCAIYLAACAVVSTLVLSSRSRRQMILSVAALAVGTALALYSVEHSHPLLVTLLLIVVFVVNGLPAQVIERILAREKIVDLAFLLGVGIVEVLFIRPYALWARGRASGHVEVGRPSLGLRRFIPGSLLASALFALLLPYEYLASIGVKYFADPEVEHIYGEGFGLWTQADLGWVAFDPVHQRLYICGNGTQVLLVLEVRGSGATLHRTRVRTEEAQFCGFSPERGEVLVYNRKAELLSWVDTARMAVTRVVETGEISIKEAETHVGYDIANDAVFLSSEFVHDTGWPRGLVVDATAGEILGRFDPGPGAIGSITMHPKGRFVYFSFFAGATGVVKFDVKSLRVVRRAPSDPRLDRLRVDVRREELLVASPVHSRVLVYDTATLEQKPYIPTVFGARSLEIDHRRDILLVASLASNELDLIDLRTRASIARFRVGPWLRDVAVDEAAGVAYVTSRHGVYRVRYAERLRR